MANNIPGELLDRILDPITQCLTPDAARRLIDLRADPDAQQRMDDLATKRNEGELTESEQAEYEAGVSAANVVAVLQSKARRILSRGASA